MCERTLLLCSAWPGLPSAPTNTITTKSTTTTSMYMCVCVCANAKTRLGAYFSSSSVAVVVRWAKIILKITWGGRAQSEENARRKKSRPILCALSVCVRVYRRCDPPLVVFVLRIKWVRANTPIHTAHCVFILFHLFSSLPRHSELHTLPKTTNNKTIPSHQKPLPPPPLRARILTFPFDVPHKPTHTHTLINNRTEQQSTCVCVAQIVRRPPSADIRTHTCTTTAPNSSYGAVLLSVCMLWVL